MKVLFKRFEGPYTVAEVWFWHGGGFTVRERGKVEYFPFLSDEVKAYFREGG